MRYVSYIIRDRILADLGFVSYQNYLASSLWKKISIEVKNRDRHKCAVCESLGTEVHHRNYDKQTLLGSKRSNLVTLCRKHHESIEFDKQGKKRPHLFAVDRELKKLVVKYRKAEKVKAIRR